MPADRRPWDPGSPALARLPFLLRAAREADRDGRLRRRLGRLLTDAGAVLSRGQPKARRSCGRPVGEHRAPRSAARLLPGPCPALPARPAALVARRRLHARSALPARPAALSALPAPLGAPAPFARPRVHRDPGTARRGSGRRGGGDRRCCCCVDHPTRLKVPAGGLGSRGGGPAQRAEVAGRAGLCPRSFAASLRPLLAVLGGVRTWAQSPLRLKRRRTPGPAPSGAGVGPADAKVTARGPACAARATGFSDTGAGSSRAGAQLCNFSLPSDGSCCFRAAGSPGSAEPRFLRLQRPISKATCGLNAFGLYYQSSFVPHYLQSLCLWTFEDISLRLLC